MNRTLISAIIIVGVTVGIALGAGIQSRWMAPFLSEIDSTAAATLMAGFGGAVVGGVISLLLSLLSLSASAVRDQHERFEKEHSQALGAIVKIMQISSRAYSLHRDVSLAVKVDPEHPSQHLRASLTQSAPLPVFAADDFTPFVKAKAADLVHRCLVFSDRVDALTTAFSAYGKLRFEMDQMAEASTTFEEDGMATTTFEGRDARIAEYRTKMLDDLVAQMDQFGAQDVAEGTAIVADMNAAYRRHFGKRSLIKFAPIVSQPNEPSP